LSNHTLVTTLGVPEYTRWGSDRIQCLTVHGGKLYSGGRDGTIKVWDCSDDTLIKTLEGHTGWVYRLTVHDGKLYSGSSGDNTIKIWDCGDYSLITTLSGHTYMVVELTFQNDKLYSSDFDGAINIWKL
jgi:WD40 repeat protein